MEILLVFVLFCLHTVGCLRLGQNIESKCDHNSRFLRDLRNRRSVAQDFFCLVGGNFSQKIDVRPPSYGNASSSPAFKSRVLLKKGMFT